MSAELKNAPPAPQTVSRVPLPGAAGRSFAAALSGRGSPQAVLWVRRGLVAAVGALAALGLGAAAAAALSLPPQDQSPDTPPVQTLVRSETLAQSAAREAALDNPPPVEIARAEQPSPDPSVADEEEPQTAEADPADLAVADAGSTPSAETAAAGPTALSEEAAPTAEVRSGEAAPAGGDRTD